jgi:hypothetical protein
MAMAMGVVEGAAAPSIAAVDASAGVDEEAAYGKVALRRGDVQGGCALSSSSIISFVRSFVRSRVSSKRERRKRRRKEICMSHFSPEYGR